MLDAGGVSTYAQAGQHYGYSLPWVPLLLIPLLIVNQEMVVRLGAVAGVGHARLINERLGRFWGWFRVGDQFLLNSPTIVTEFIGVSLALSYFGVSKYISVPVAAVMLVAIPWVNPRWLNILASIIIAVLLMLSGVLVATTLFPSVNTTQVAIWLSGILVVGLAAAGVSLRIVRIRSGSSATAVPQMSRDERTHWRMPPLALLTPCNGHPASNSA